MLKRIIFDVDGTLIDVMNFRLLVERMLKEKGISYTEEDLDAYMLAIQTYEDEYINYDFNNYLEHIKSNCGLDIDAEYMKAFLNRAGEYVPEVGSSIGLRNTLEYLKEKYELVVLTNYFRKVQENRLRNFGILSYFDEIYGGDSIIKPATEAFRIAQGNNKRSECLMIGDSLQLDYLGAINFGMDAILIDKTIDKSTPNKIKSVKELKHIL